MKSRLDHVLLVSLFFFFHSPTFGSEDEVAEEKRASCDRAKEGLVQLARKIYDHKGPQGADQSSLGQLMAARDAAAAIESVQNAFESVRSGLEGLAKEIVDIPEDSALDKFLKHYKDYYETLLMLERFHHSLHDNVWTLSQADFKNGYKGDVKKLVEEKLKETCEEGEGPDEFCHLTSDSKFSKSFLKWMKTIYPGRNFKKNFKDFITDYLENALTLQTAGRAVLQENEKLWSSDIFENSPDLIKGLGFVADIRQKTGADNLVLPQNIETKLKTPDGRLEVSREIKAHLKVYARYKNDDEVESTPERVLSSLNARAQALNSFIDDNTQDSQYQAALEKAQKALRSLNSLKQFVDCEDDRHSSKLCKSINAIEDASSCLERSMKKATHQQRLSTLNTCIEEFSEASTGLKDPNGELKTLLATRFKREDPELKKFLELYSYVAADTLNKCDQAKVETNAEFSPYSGCEQQNYFLPDEAILQIGDGSFSNFNTIFKKELEKQDLRPLADLCKNLGKKDAPPAEHELLFCQRHLQDMENLEKTIAYQNLEPEYEPNRSVIGLDYARTLNAAQIGNLGRVWGPLIGTQVARWAGFGNMASIYTPYYGNSFWNSPTLYTPTTGWGGSPMAMNTSGFFNNSFSASAVTPSWAPSI